MVLLVGELANPKSDTEPVSPTVLGLPTALSLMVSVPGRVPVRVGVKTMLRVQLEEVGNAEGQLLVSL
jgi:hypothetical protein